jgi:hypothetical protein
MKENGYNMSDLKTEKSVRLKARFHEETPHTHCATGYGGGIKCDNFQKYTFVHFWGSKEKPVCEHFKIGLIHDDVKVIRCPGCISAFINLPEIKEEEKQQSDNRMIPFRR